jgi:hypothetical protein
MLYLRKSGGYSTARLWDLSRASLELLTTTSACRILHLHRRCPTPRGHFLLRRLHPCVTVWPSSGPFPQYRLLAVPHPLKPHPNAHHHHTPAVPTQPKYSAHQGRIGAPDLGDVGPIRWERQCWRRGEDKGPIFAVGQRRGHRWGEEEDKEELDEKRPDVIPSQCRIHIDHFVALPSKGLGR